MYELLHRVRSGEHAPFKTSMLPVLEEGRVHGVFFAVGGDSRSHASGSDLPLRGSLTSLDVALRALDDTPGMRVLRTREDVQALGTDEIGFVLVLEGGRPLEGSIAMLRQFYRLGVRCLLLTWNGRNELADGVGEGSGAGGLSNFGRSVVREMHQLGMVLDLSHLAAAGFYEAIDLYDGIVTATHSNARALHDHPRNLTDEQIRLVADTGGVVGVAFMPAFLADGAPTVETVADHIEYMVNLVGDAHVGIGPDFSYPPVAEEHRKHRAYEGIKVDLQVPYPIPDAAALPQLEKALQSRGFSELAIRNVLGDNLLRVLKAVLPEGQNKNLN